jgi:hypothetical protein
MPVSLNVNTYTAKSNYHDSSDPNEYDSDLADLATIDQVSNSNSFNTRSVQSYVVWSIYVGSAQFLLLLFCKVTVSFIVRMSKISTRV